MLSAIRRFRRDLFITADTWRIATLIALIGLALTAGLGWTLHTTSQETLNNRFQSAAAERAGIIVEKLKSNLRELDAVRRFYEGSLLVSRDEFRRFVTPRCV